MENINTYHIPVLFQEVIDNLIKNPDGIYLDCTLGGGGHSEGILKKLSSVGKLIAIDQDDKAIEFSKKRLASYKEQFQVFKNNFENLDIVLYAAGVDKVDGILMDIGVSSEQLDDPQRGFSYRYDAKLDMRMNQNSDISAYDIVNDYSEEELSRIIFQYGEERHSRKIAKLIAIERQKYKIETTFQLVDIIKRAYSERAAKHPAKKTFQALRIEVNKELEVLEKAIYKATESLKVGGLLGIITFHSIEDRIVKNTFKSLATACKCPPEVFICNCNGKAEVKIITKKPIIPHDKEVKSNNRAHSSKLRIVERI